MKAFPIEKNLNAALKKISHERRDALGYLRYTFRIELNEPEVTIDSLLGDLTDRGWQMVANPVIVEKENVPRHVILSMIHFEPSRLRMRFHATGGLDGEMRSEP